MAPSVVDFTTIDLLAGQRVGAGGWWYHLLLGSQPLVTWPGTG